MKPIQLLVISERDVNYDGEQSTATSTPRVTSALLSLPHPCVTSIHENIGLAHAIGGLVRSVEPAAIVPTKRDLRRILQHALALDAPAPQLTVRSKYILVCIAPWCGWIAHSHACFLVVNNQLAPFEPLLSQQSNTEGEHSDTAGSNETNSAEAEESSTWPVPPDISTDATSSFAGRLLEAVLDAIAASLYRKLQASKESVTHCLKLIDSIIAEAATDFANDAVRRISATQVGLTTYYAALSAYNSCLLSLLDSPLLLRTIGEQILLPTGTPIEVATPAVDSRRSIVMRSAWHAQEQTPLDLVSADAERTNQLNTNPSSNESAIITTTTSSAAVTAPTIDEDMKDGTSSVTQEHIHTEISAMKQSDESSLLQQSLHILGDALSTTECALHSVHLDMNCIPAEDAEVLIPYLQPTNTKVKVFFVDVSLPHVIFKALTRTGVAPPKKKAATGDKKKTGVK